MLFFVFQGAYVRFPPVTLDIDGYLVCHLNSLD